MQRNGGGSWALLGLLLLASPVLAPILFASYPVGHASMMVAAVSGTAERVVLPTAARPTVRPRAERGTRPDGGRAARAPRTPRGLQFTSAHGCQPARDWRDPRLDPRVRTLLTRAASRIAIRVSCLRSGHSTYVAGTTRVSNHTVWRAADIDRVAGRPVGPGNPAAKQLALAIGRGELGVQPSEVGSPWDVGGVHFSDASHQGHVHVGFGR